MARYDQNNTIKLLSVVYSNGFRENVTKLYEEKTKADWIEKDNPENLSIIGLYGTINQKTGITSLGLIVTYE